jgi:hypothetical protein
MAEPISDEELARVRERVARGQDFTFWEGVDVIPALLARLDRAEGCAYEPDEEGVCRACDRDAAAHGRPAPGQLLDCECGCPAHELDRRRR